MVSLVASFIGWIAEALFHTACGWIGHHLLRIVTLGRVAPEWGEGSESAVAEWVGLMAILVAVSALAWLLVA